MMPAPPRQPHPNEAPVVLAASDLQRLLDALYRRDYSVMGPVLDDGAIVYREVRHLRDLPAGWTDEQAPGAYRVTQHDRPSLFHFAVGPHSLKRYFFPPRRKLWSATRDEDNGTFEIHPAKEETPRLAFLGVRACELAALAVQDRVFMEGTHVDPVYAARRRAAFLVAVNCSHAASTCFCTSMGTGPEVRSGYDLALTELLDEGRHAFLVEVGSAEGADVLADLPVRPATEDDQAEALRVTERTAASIQRRLDTTDLRDLLLGHLDNPHWEDVGARCLSCANCTLVCPTCFCHTVEDVTDLTGEHTERWQAWDSCFTLRFSHLHAGSVRATAPSRYRQWATHKLATWIDQFGTSGCVGCGRCITWCPVGIDLTEEIRTLRETEPLPATATTKIDP